MDEFNTHDNSLTIFSLRVAKIKQNNKTSVFHLKVLLKSFKKRIYMIKNELKHQQHHFIKAFALKQHLHIFPCQQSSSEETVEKRPDLRCIL